MRRTVKSIVAGNEPDQPLPAYLFARFTYHDETEWRSIIDDGRIHINGETAATSSVVRADDVLEYHPDFEKHREPEVARDIQVVFEDEYLLAVNKPGNLPCHPGGRYFNNTLWALLKEKHPMPGNATPRIVNRLDRETSGLVVIAKSAEIAKTLSAQFKEKTAQKQYVVLVEGETDWQQLVAEGVLVQDTASAVRKKLRFIDKTQCDSEQADIGISCKTSFRKIGYENGVTTLMADLETGRMHQIRATLCSLGLPVVGDKIYGVDDNIFIRFISGELSESDNARLRLKRQALHHFRFKFIHPGTGKITALHAPIPDDWSGLMPVSLQAKLYHI
jgi:RluA family pseudouridine synthase